LGLIYAAVIACSRRSDSGAPLSERLEQATVVNVRPSVRGEEKLGRRGENVCFQEIGCQFMLGVL